jgi:hypothetical protein
MNEFEILNDELDQWNYQGEEAMLWWRDDDAQEASAALTRLLGLSERFDIPVSLAVIPMGADPSLVDVVARSKQAAVLQHGFSHTNYAASDEKKQELGAHRDVDLMQQQISQGFQSLKQAFGERFVPALVPPWNRITHGVIEVLGTVGLMGLSTFGPRIDPEPAQGIWQINTHADIIDWKNEKCFIGTAAVVEQLVRHLRGRRQGQLDRAEPTGLLTHHLVHDDDCWSFLTELFAILDEHPAVTWLSAERVFQSRWR